MPTSWRLVSSNPSLRVLFTFQTRLKNPVLTYLKTADNLTPINGSENRIPHFKRGNNLYPLAILRSKTGFLAAGSCSGDRLEENSQLPWGGKIESFLADTRPLTWSAWSAVHGVKIPKEHRRFKSPPSLLLLLHPQFLVWHLGHLAGMDFPSFHAFGLDFHLKPQWPQ